MVCTYCNSNTSVTNSRLQKRTNSVWRRRKCTHCGALFSTTEHVDFEKSWVVQYPNGQLSPFVREKLFLSLYQSCQHRTTALQDGIGLTATVMSHVGHDIHDGRVTTALIASAAQQALKRFDKAAAMHYQAYHPDIL